jgi:hypothetical protein
VKDSSDHRVCLIDKLSKSLLLIDSSQYHLMLALLTHVLYRRCLGVVTISHRSCLDTSICDAFGRDEFLVQFWCSKRSLDSLDLWLVLTNSTINIELFCFYNVVFFVAKTFFFLSLSQIQFFLGKDRWNGSWVNITWLWNSLIIWSFILRKTFLLVTYRLRS